MASLAQHRIEGVSCDDLLARSDAVSLHVPLNPETRGMVNRDFLAKMRRGSYLDQHVARRTCGRSRPALRLCDRVTWAAQVLTS